MVSDWKSENKIDIEKIKQYFNRVPSGFYMRLRKKVRTYGGKGFEISLKPTTFYNQVTLNYVDKYSTKSIKIFPNGSIQIAGCADLFNCRSVIKIIHTMLKNFLKNDDLPKDDSYRVVMINSNFSLNYNINLMEIKSHFENVKPKNKSCTFKVSLFCIKIFSITSTFEPNTATIPPCPLGTEFCMASPLILNIFKVSEKSKYPAHDKAEYSPKECPAKYFALFKSNLNSFFTTLNIE